MAETGDIKVYGWPVKIAAVLLMAVQMLQALVNPSLTGIMGEFPGAATTTYQTIINIAPLTQIVAALIVGAIVHKVGFKTLSIVGCIFALIGGCGMIWFGSSVGQLIGIRAIFGVGYGFVYGLSVAAAGEFWRGKETTQVSGLISLMCGICGVVYNLAEAAIIGAIGDANWRLCYHINWIIIPILIYVLIFLPQRNTNPDAMAADGEKKSSGGVAGLGAKYWMCMLTVVITLGAVCVFMNNIAMVVIAAGLNPASIGLIMTGFTAGMLIGGPFYIATYRALKRYAMPFYFVLDIVGFLVMMFVPGFVPYTCAAVLIGIVFSSINSGWYDMAAKKVVAYPDSSALGGSILVSVAGISQFIGPFWVAFLATAIFRQPEANPFYQYYPALTILVVGAIILFIMSAKNHGIPEYEREMQK